MLSTRLNKEGKEIPSIKTPYEPYDNDNYNWKQRFPHLVGVDREDDERWINPHRRADTYLSKETNLGCALVQKPGLVTNMPVGVRQHNQDELNQFLVRMNRFSPGDIITFATYPSMGAMVSFTTMTYILSVDRMIEDCVWNEKESDPKPFLALDLSALLPNSTAKMTARYINCLYNRHITADEKRQIVNNNVLLPNYIQQAKDALKAGTLTIRT